MSTAIAGALQLNSVEIDPSVSGGLVRKVDHRYVYTDARSASFHSNGGDVIELPPAGVRLEALIKSEPQSLALLLFEILEATQSKTPRLTLELKGGKSNIPELLDSAAQQLRELDIHWCLLTRT